MPENLKNSKDWQELTHLTQGQPIVVERVRLTEKDIAIEGSFELPQLARLAMEDQIFVTAFVRSHGSIKEMERVFGVSYPTIKSRLTRIADSLEFVETNPTTGKIGKKVIILGNNLIATTGVEFNGTSAKFEVVSGTEITTKVPKDATTGYVTVTTPNGTLTSNVPFLVP